MVCRYAAVRSFRAVALSLQEAFVAIFRQRSAITYINKNRAITGPARLLDAVTHGEDEDGPRVKERQNKARVGNCLDPASLSAPYVQASKRNRIGRRSFGLMLHRNETEFTARSRRGRGGTWARSAHVQASRRARRVKLDLPLQALRQVGSSPPGSGKPDCRVCRSPMAPCMYCSRTSPRAPVWPRAH